MKCGRYSRRNSPSMKLAVSKDPLLRNCLRMEGRSSSMT